MVLLQKNNGALVSVSGEWGGLSDLGRDEIERVREKREREKERAESRGKRRLKYELRMTDNEQDNGRE